MTDTAPTSEGLRDRKKRATRDSILLAARRLFMDKGFDDVTVAEIAAAADVSEKTVFNHFPSKEDLALAGGEERVAAVIEAVRTRPGGTPVIEVFRAATLLIIDEIEHGDVDAFLAVPRMVRSSKTLRGRLPITWEREAAALAPVVAEAAGVPDDDVVAAVVTRTLTWTDRMIIRRAFQGLMAGEAQHAVAARLRAETARVYDQLAEGLGGYGVAGPGPQGPT